MCPPNYGGVSASALAQIGKPSEAAPVRRQSGAGPALHRPEAVRVETADDDPLRAPAQHDRHLAGVVTLGALDRVGANDRAAVHLPEARRVELRQQLAQRDADEVLASPETMHTLLGVATAPRLETIAAGSGSAVHFVPVNAVVYFEAADKYVRVLTADREHLIRVSLRELLPQLDPARFWQVHRGTVVRADAIERAERDDAGKVTLVLRQRPERIVVSRLYAHRFRPM